MIYKALRDISEIRDAKRVINNALHSDDAACINNDLNKAKKILDAQETKIRENANKYYNKYKGDVIPENDNRCETCAHFPRPIFKDDYSSEIVCDWKDGGICEVDNEIHKPSQCACNFYLKTHYL